MRRRTVTLGAAATVIAAATFMTFFHAAVAAEFKFSVGVGSLEASLSRVLNRRDLAVVIARHREPDVLEVVEVLFGDIATGHRLLFEDCLPLLMMGSTEDYLRRIMDRSPVLDLPARGLRSVELPDGRTLGSYPPAAPDARYLVFLDYRTAVDQWGFAHQTYGDFYLLGSERVFRSIYLEELLGKAWVRVYPEMTSDAFLDHVKARLAAERAGAGAAAKSAAP